MTGLPVSPFVIRADVMQAHADAAAIRADAAAQAAASAEQTALLRREAVAAGHSEGLEAGMAQAARLASEAAAAAEAFLNERAAELQDLGFAIAHRLLASLPRDEILTRLAAEAVAEHRTDVQLTLRVCDADVAPLRAALAEADPHGRVAVMGEPSAAPGSCTLVHGRGRTRLGLLDQFRALMGAAA